MISGVGAALSGLQAFAGRLENNGNNVANMNTEGFKRGSVLLREQLPQGVRTESRKLESSGPLAAVETGTGVNMVEQSNVDLSEELTEMMTNEHGFKANLKYLRAADDMTESLLDIKA